MNNNPIILGGVTIKPGEKREIEFPGASLYTQTPINIAAHVFHGLLSGPRLFVMAAVHGDEINGVEIIRRLLIYRRLKYLRGTLIVVPVANIHGFISLSRYLPDRRDLNRAFPGSKTGSLTARLAYLIMDEIISKCTHGIDLHTGNIRSDNFPHIRANTKHPATFKMARAFNTPVILDAGNPEGSIRQAASKLNIPLLVFEGGEALRFNEMSIRIGLRGIINVLSHLRMIPKIKPLKHRRIKSKVSYSSSWIRSPQSGIFHQQRALGTVVEKGERIGLIANPFTGNETQVFSTISGIIISRNTLPLVNEGDALFHVARLKGVEEVTDHINELKNYYLDNPDDYF